MDPNRKITKKFDSKANNRHYFHRKTGLKFILLVLSILDARAESLTKKGSLFGRFEEAKISF